LPAFAHRRVAAITVEDVATLLTQLGAQGCLATARSGAAIGAGRMRVAVRKQGACSVWLRER
jgi:hypothetical protein